LKPTEDEVTLFTTAIALTLITRVRDRDLAKAKHLIARKVRDYGENRYSLVKLSITSFRGFALKLKFNLITYCFYNKLAH